MATYEVTAPDGSVFEIDAPDTATESEVIAYAQAQFQQPETINPTEGMSGLQRFAAGAGKAFSDIGTGLYQTGLAAADVIPGVDLTQQRESVRQQVAEERALSEPLMQTGAGLGGNIAGNVAALAPTAFIPGAATLGGSALIGAGSGAIQPTVSTAETATGGLLGAGAGLLGAGITRGVSRLVRPTQGLTPQAQKAAAPVVAQGGRLTAGQASGSPVLQKIEASMEAFPPTAGAMAKVKGQNQSVINRLAARAIGEDADALTQDVLENAYGRIGQTFNSVATPNPVPVNPRKLAVGVAQINNELRGVVNVNSNPLVQEALGIAGTGQATGQQLQHLSSRLRTVAEQQIRQPTGDRELGRALFRVRELVDDQLMEGLPQAEREAFRQAREQYRNLMLLTTNKNVLNEQTGNVSGRNLASTLRSKDKSAYLFGKGARSAETKGLYEAARFERQFAPIVGDSGTATRQFLPQAVGLGVVGGVGGAASGGDATTGALTGAAIPLALAGAARGYTNPAVTNYLLRGIPALQFQGSAPNVLSAVTRTLPIGAVQSGQ